MTKFLDMNDDCIEYLLKYFDPESIVAISQTCKKLHLIATGHFKKHTSYICSIASDEDEKRAKRTIANIGKSLVALNLNVAEGYKELKPIFLVRFPQMCPNLQKLEIIGNVSPNVVFDSVQSLQHLDYLCVRTYINDEKVTELCAARLAREIKTLQTLNVFGTEWDHRAVINFIH